MKKKTVCQYKLIIKRSLDVSLAISGLVLLLPILLFLIFLQLVVTKGKPFYRQKRPGLNGRIFTLYKFRTMTEEKDEEGKLLPEMDRVTRLGRFLRNTSFDELPQLWNILKGDMSFVGPRPLLEEYLPMYNDLQSRRHEVMPGLTGWAQIQQEKLDSWERKFEADIWYVDHYSLRLDLMILLKTFKAAIQPSLTKPKSQKEFERFRGSL